MKIFKRALALTLSLALMVPAMTVGAADLSETMVNATASATPTGNNGVVNAGTSADSIDFTVKDKDGKTLTKDKDYVVIVSGDCDVVGSHTAKIIGVGKYTINEERTFEVKRPAKADRQDATLSVYASAYTVKANKWRKTVKLAAVTNNTKGTVSYALVGKPKGAGNKVKVKVGSDGSGSVIVKKGAKKGVYKIRVTVWGTKTKYNHVHKTIKITVK